MFRRCLQRYLVQLSAPGLHVHMLPLPPKLFYYSPIHQDYSGDDPEDMALSHSADVWATWLEEGVPSMIERVILTLIPLQTSIDDHMTRFTTFESRQGASLEVIALYVKVADMKNVVEYLKSTDFTSLLEEVNNIDASTTFEIPPTDTRFV